MCMELSADSKEPVGAPANEVEVTPAMIEAGGDALYDHLSYDPRMYRAWAESLAEIVLRAALRCPQSKI